MKYEINYERLKRVFHNYMEENYGLVYESHDFLIRDRDGDLFAIIDNRDGDIFAIIDNRNDHFYFYDTEDDNGLTGFFGDNTYELLLDYLREKFPQLEISGIE